jgi:general secretion pathway protein G
MQHERAPLKTPASRRGFTLAEMMVVIVIIGLLATLVVPNVIAKYQTAAREKARSDVVQITNALNECAIRNSGRYPDSLDVLVTPDEHGYTYLSSRALPRDPWKHEYVYEPPSSSSGTPLPRVVCCGPDGQPGGGDDIDNLDAGR